MAEDRYFVIRSQHEPSLVLDIGGWGKDPGTRVVTWDYHGGENQQWYEDHITGTIRTRLNDFCLDTSGQLVINPYQAGDPNQQWKCQGDHIVNRADNDKVFDIGGASRDKGAAICAYGCHGGSNQKWTFEHIPARFFFIESKMNGKVLDIGGENKNPGAEVIMYSKKDSSADNQLWYQGRDGVIRSKLSDLILDASQGDVVMNNYNPSEHQHCWVVHEDRVVNQHNHDQVLDIAGANDDDFAHICGYSFHGGENQLWNFNYIN